MHNLPWHCTWQQLKDLFKEWKVERADIVVDQYGRSRCEWVLGFVGRGSGLLSGAGTVNEWVEVAAERGHGSTPRWELEDLEGCIGSQCGTARGDRQGTGKSQRWLMLGGWSIRIIAKALPP